jgi:hypothetical protein
MTIIGHNQLLYNWTTDIRILNLRMYRMNAKADKCTVCAIPVQATEYTHIIS